MARKTKTTGVVHNASLIERPPIIVVMGHIDHGKSTLLDSIRKTNVVGGEAGGITQHLSAYEVIHKTPEGKEKPITFLDTPGHEAFQKMRFRGAEIADIAIVVVSAEDGVKAQTLEALECIKKSGIPFIVAINKIDKPNANIERTQESLLKSGIYLEKLGGEVPWVPISAKRGDGIPELLDVTLLLAELQELKASLGVPAEGIVIESNLDQKKGIAATLIIRNGELKKGSFVASGKSFAPVRIMEDHFGKPLERAAFSSPVRIVGWSSLPQAGAPFHTFANKRDAEEMTRTATSITRPQPKRGEEAPEHMTIIPIILKADAAGTLDAIEHELEKLQSERVRIKVIKRDVGTIGENDVKLAQGAEGSLLLGFNTKVDSAARDLADRSQIEIQTFDIIYKLSEWLAQAVKARTPSIEMEEVTGRAKILKSFSRVKNKQVIGARVEQGSLSLKASLRIIRKDTEIGRGHVSSLQRNKESVSKVDEGMEFGTQVDSALELLPGDYLEVVVKTQS
jgi:translation initiation factor IF-2